MKLHSIKFTAMGSPCELQLYMNEALAATVVPATLQLIKQLEEKYSRYRSDSLTTKINSAAGSDKSMPVDEETARLLDYAEVMYQQSDGLFDITSGVLRKAWNFKSQSLPQASQIEPLLPLIGWHKIEWAAPYIYLPFAGMELDFGGFVKEYAADAAAALCIQHGVVHGLINLGGDIHVVGPHPDGTPWKVGIRHPRIPERSIANIEITQGAIATSGDYERFMVVNGVRYCHLLNPFTGMSIQPFYSSASITASQCIIAGSFSTIALLKSVVNPDWLAASGLPHLLIDQHMSISGTVDTGQKVR